MPQVEHVFTLVNNTRSPEIITTLQPSCGCTSALIGGADSLPFTVAPGKSYQVKVITNLRYLIPGEIDKYVYVLSKDQLPIATLEMSGTLKPPAEISPSALDFGIVPCGSTRSLLLNVSFSPSLLASGNPPHMLSSSSDLSVKQVRRRSSLQGGRGPLAGRRVSVA